jgi:hypothetical protein
MKSVLFELNPLPEAGAEWTDGARELVCVPQPEMFESPVSWLSRMALSQGVTVKEVLHYFGIQRRGDLDMDIAGADLDGVARVSGVQKAHFAFMRHMFLSLRSVDDDGAKYLLSSGNRARYRYCAKCLSGQRTAHFQVHWRFDAWRWCPLHNCTLRDCCPACGAFPVLPRSLIHAGPKREGVASLRLCCDCGANLSAHPRELPVKGPKHYSSVEGHRLRANGRALLAALYYGKFRLKGAVEAFPISGIAEIERQGHLPHGPWHLDRCNALARAVD